VVDATFHHRKRRDQATYQAILKLHTYLLKVWNLNFLTAFGTTPTMFYISYGATSVL